MVRLRSTQFTFIVILVLSCQLTAVAMNKTDRSAVTGTKLINASNLSRLTNASLGEITALCEVGGKTYGAGSGKVSQLDDSGAVVRSIPVSISKVGGIAPFDASSMIVADTERNSLSKLDTETGKLNPMLSLSQVNITGFPAGNVMRDGQLAGVAYDGTNVYVAYNAGFSSSIFKLDARSGKLLAHGWSPGQDTSALATTDDGLVALSRDGKEIRPYSSDIKQTLEVIPVQASGANGIVVKGTEIKILSTVDKAIIKMRIPQTIKTSISPVTVQNRFKDIIKNRPELLRVNKYAVLVCGDVAESGYYYDSFWNDTLWMYKTLLDAGFTKENIYVLYGYGSDSISNNPAYRYPEKITDFPATIPYLNKVLDGMKNGDAASGIAKVTDADTLFIWTFDHGAGGNPVYLCLRDGWYKDSDLSAKINAVPCAKRAIFMQQCHSGGFIPLLARDDTFISTACRADQSAYVSTTLYEVYGGREYHHGIYNYHIISAISGKTPTGAAVNADANSNGKVTSLECHNWEATHKTGSETPQMSDVYGIGAAFCAND